MQHVRDKNEACSLWFYLKAIKKLFFYLILFAKLKRNIFVSIFFFCDRNKIHIFRDMTNFNSICRQKKMNQTSPSKLKTIIAIFLFFVGFRAKLFIRSFQTPLKLIFKCSNSGFYNENFQMLLLRSTNTVWILLLL